MIFASFTNPMMKGRPYHNLKGEIFMKKMITKSTNGLVEYGLNVLTAMGVAMIIQDVYNKFKK